MTTDRFKVKPLNCILCLLTPIVATPIIAAILEKPVRVVVPVFHNLTQTASGTWRDDVARADEWEGAEVLVVGAGGNAVPGRGRLEWCGVCGVHVLAADLEVSDPLSLRKKQLPPPPLRPHARTHTLVCFLCTQHLF